MQYTARDCRKLDHRINASGQRRLRTEKDIRFGQSGTMFERGTRSPSLRQNPSANHYHQVARWATVTSIDSFLEMILVLLSAYLLSSLHMRLRTKLTVISAFGFRLG